MAYTRFEQTEVDFVELKLPHAPERSEEVQREELLRKIESLMKSMSLRELEALYYELSTKNYINERV